NADKPNTALSNEFTPPFGSSSVCRHTLPAILPRGNMISMPIKRRTQSIKASVLCMREISMTCILDFLSAKVEEIYEQINSKNETTKFYGEVMSKQQLTVKYRVTCQLRKATVGCVYQFKCSFIYICQQYPAQTSGHFQEPQKTL